ncbi:hypothetical protein PS726_01830 [Pseudomonas fluorescens]|uniref:hypothetical protein n=1 Tax=Pseudomonas fluorescens TaxID=294 RepID=UPI000FB4836F|nr:hypothetical protein [Pseudomonas fluorescens]VVM61183.1 hypothetical protein PS647_01306 [Pseudomonas fluorescens]VVN90392.1 hypothetical protein PS726_01830 [Pseudomonas fluorescens]VVO55858.1 hypothetical protein PS843_00522 [Pseudomonas fluorescens]
MNSRQIVLMAFLALSAAATVSAQDSKAYAQMATASWSAFECSSLASKAGKPKEQERLFLYGYEQGKTFISAVQAGKVEQKDLSSEAPWIMLLLLEGPSPDFMLGRIYESAQNSALKDVYKTGDQFNSDEEQIAIAANEFRKLNCQLIGNVR